MKNRPNQSVRNKQTERFRKLDIFCVPRNIFVSIIIASCIYCRVVTNYLFFFPDDNLPSLSQPNSPGLPSAMQLQNRYHQNVIPQNSSLLAPNLLATGLSAIGQPYSAEICNYGPMYHPHNILHNYNTVYSNDKTIRNGNFNRTMYGNYHGFYSNNTNLRSPGLHQNSYEFAPR